MSRAIVWRVTQQASLTPFTLRGCGHAPTTTWPAGKAAPGSRRRPRHGLGDGGQEAKAEARGPKGAAPSHRPPPIPGPRRLPAGTFSRAGGTESRINVSSARSPLQEPANAGKK